MTKLADDTMTDAELSAFLDIELDAGPIQTCAGAWVREEGGVWRFHEYEDWYE